MSSIHTFCKLLKTPKKLVGPLGNLGLFNWLPDKAYLELLYYCETGHKLDLKNPRTYNEKLQWLKLYDRKPQYHMMVDKLEVKDYISKRIGRNYIIPTIGVWNNVEDIDFGTLPSRFVLKCTHDSGSAIICRDKDTFDFGSAKKKLREHMKRSTYWYGREWPYKGLFPRIIAEEYIEDSNGKQPDYKVMCFQGVPRLIQIHIDRYTDKHIHCFYDTNWEKQNMIQRGAPATDIQVDKPSCLAEMLSLSAALSKGYPELRVDWYVIDGHLFFGELTFFDASGFNVFSDPEIELMLGNWINLDMK